MAYPYRCGLETSKRYSEAVMRISLEIVKLKYRAFIGGVIALVIIFGFAGALIANNMQTERYGKLLAFAKCDDRGAVFLKFSDGSEWNCMPREQIPPNKPVKK
jgi:endo-1,4-beta-mannosidase